VVRVCVCDPQARSWAGGVSPD